MEVKTRYAVGQRLYYITDSNFIRAAKVRSITAHEQERRAGDTELKISNDILIYKESEHSVSDSEKANSADYSRNCSDQSERVYEDKAAARAALMAIVLGM